MYFRTPLATPRAQGGAGAWWAAVACALLLIGIGVYPGPLMREAERANSGQAASCAKPQSVDLELSITEEKPPLQSAP